VAHLASIEIPSGLARWTLDWVNFWVDQQKNHLVSKARALELQLETLEKTRKRLVDLVVRGVITSQEYEEQKLALERDRFSVQTRLADPQEALRSWERLVGGVVTDATSAVATFKAADDDTRRAMLSRMYENLPVLERNTAPVLRPEHQLLVSAPKAPDSGGSGDVNLPRVEEILLNENKKARSSDARFRALFAWCAKLHEVRTGSRASGASTTPSATGN